MWTLGTLIGLPIAIILFFAAIVLSRINMVLWRRRRPTDENDSLLLGFGISFGVVAVIVAVVTVLTYWPFQAAYHQYRPVSGTVETINSRIVSNGDSSDQKFVVTLIQNPEQPYGVSDTRASLLKPGDTVHLRCIRKHDYGSNNAGYDCKWGR